MTLRAQNYLNVLSQASAATAAGASLLYICPTNDEAAMEVLAELGQQMYEADSIDGNVYVRLAEGNAIYDSSTVTPTRYSKLALRRALRARGLEEFFEAALDSNVQTRRDWDDAVELWSIDPIMSQAVPAFAAALQLQADDVTAILSEAAV